MEGACLFTYKMPTHSINPFSHKSSWCLEWVNMTILASQNGNKLRRWLSVLWISQILLKLDPLKSDTTAIKHCIFSKKYGNVHMCILWGTAWGPKPPILHFLFSFLRASDEKYDICLCLFGTVVHHFVCSPTKFHGSRSSLSVEVFSVFTYWNFLLRYNTFKQIHRYDTFLDTAGTNQKINITRLWHDNNDCSSIVADMRRMTAVNIKNNREWESTAGTSVSVPWKMSGETLSNIQN